MRTNDPLLGALARLDPGVSDPPPIEGSARYDDIIEHAMRVSPGAFPVTPREPNLAAAVASPNRHVIRRRLTMAAAVAAAVLAVVAIVVRPGHTPVAAALVGRAADSTGEVRTLRMRLTAREPDGTVQRSEGEADGPDFRITNYRILDGRTVKSSWVTVDDTMWLTDQGRTTSEPVSPHNRLSPFGLSSAAVVHAVLEGGGVTDLGTEVVNGVSSKHYRLTVDDTSRSALAAVPQTKRNWFDIQHPKELKTLEVWVADGLMRRIHLVSPTQDEIIDLTDFGADITIDPPA